VSEHTPEQFHRHFSRLLQGESLSAADAEAVMGELMDGHLTPAQAGGLLAALRTRGETVDEITGFARAMRGRAVTVPVDEAPLVDLCGTGGTGLATLNVSTTAAFVVAAAGGKVAKHGNRGVTKQSGSADVLEALGVHLDVPEAALGEAVTHTGVAFLFARRHHPAMRHAAPVRAELKARTVFNVLGPLTNPAGATRQLLGVYDPSLVRPLAEVLRGLGTERALVVHGGGLDDFTLAADTVAAELHADGRVEERTFSPEAVGLKRAALDAISGGDAQENARLTREVLSGRDAGPHADVVAFNAGAALYLAGLAANVPAGVTLARDTLASGKPLETLEAYAAFTRTFV
jgi:anthranilate phosphoribosyltransferase